MSRILGEQGFAVHVAGSGEVGLRILEKKAVDLVLLDVLLPGMDGLQTLRRIKALRPGTPVIMMTGHETVKTAVEAMKLGAYDYLPKPLTPDRLGQSIQQALQVKALEASSLPQVPRRPKPITPEEMVGQSLSMVAIFDLVRRISPQDLTVLIRGESGTGKEMIAQAIHALSPRREKPFVPVDCASLPESLFESELFGYERGAFTGADAPKEGRFEQAESGTLFLDEIGNLTLAAQAKLLRVLQEREISRLGGKRPIQIDVRILAATNQNLDDLMEKQLFREDLFHRLNVFSIALPPLRHRDEDVKLLCRFFLDRFNQELGRRVRGISDEAMKLLSGYSWPGNVRELGNTLKSAILLAEEEIFPEHLPEKVRSIGAGGGMDETSRGSKRQDGRSSAPAPFSESLRETSRCAAEGAEKQLILRTLRETRGNKRAAAQRLGIDYKTLFNKLKAFRVTKDQVEAMRQTHG